MKILVTGGAGFIGSHLVRKLQAEGHEAVALDNLSTGLRENLPEGTELIEMDVCGEGLENIVAVGNFDAIVHLAGQTMVNVSIENPAFDAEQNILGTIHVLEAARKNGVAEWFLRKLLRRSESIDKETVSPFFRSFTGIPLKVAFSNVLIFNFLYLSLSSNS